MCTSNGYIPRFSYLGLVSFAAIAVVGTLTQVSAQEYDVDEIGPLPGGNRITLYGVSEDGRVVGSSSHKDDATGETTQRRALIWQKGSGSTPLADLQANCGSYLSWEINNNNRASGTVYNCVSGSKVQRAALWNISAGTVSDLGTFSDGSVNNDSSNAYGINDSERVVGHADLPPYPGYEYAIFHAFLWTTAGGKQDLGTLASPDSHYGGFSVAYDINNANQVVGLASDPSWYYKGFIWDQTNGMRALPVHSSYPNGEWHAVALNNSGVIGGHVVVSADQYYPAYWATATTSPTLITMPSGFPYGEIYDVNNSSQFAGMMWVSDAEDSEKGGFIYDSLNGARNLTDLIDSTRGITITSAAGINDKGYVAAAGKRGDQRYGYRLVPRGTPIPSAGWTCTADSEETTALNGRCQNAYDGKLDTAWHTSWSGTSPLQPHNIDLNLGRTYLVNGLRYVPRQADGSNGIVSQYEIYTSKDGTNWTKVASGSWTYSGKEAKYASFTTTEASRIRFKSLDDNSHHWTSAAEIIVLGDPAGVVVPSAPMGLKVR